MEVLCLYPIWLTALLVIDGSEKISDQNLLIGDMYRPEEVAAFQVRAMMLREVNATLQTNVSYIWNVWKTQIIYIAVSEKQNKHFSESHVRFWTLTDKYTIQGGDNNETDKD